MSLTIALMANTLDYPEGGGHAWVYLNWALGLKSLGCRMIWIERLGLAPEPEKASFYVRSLFERLKRYGLDDSICIMTKRKLPELTRCVSFDAAEAADLLINLQYDLPDELIRCFRRSVLLDIDPGLLQVWMKSGQIHPGQHDVYFTTGETVGKPGGPIPDCGIKWHHITPCIALDAWPIMPVPSADAPFTTVSHWYADEWVESGGEVYANDKRSGFLQFLDLPQMVKHPLELALCLGDDAHERQELITRGWRICDSEAVSRTPWDYQHYIQSSRGEFSCVKPSCIRLQNAWISDRTLCYLASGRPAVVQHTGPSRILPDRLGLLRFRDLNDAAACINEANAQYEQHSNAARALVEEIFDAKKVAHRFLELAF